MKFLVSSGMASSQLWPSADQRVVPAFATSEIGVLPLGALYEIFLHLSAKDLCRLRVVCRQWRFLLSDSKFMEAHGARHMRPLIISRYMDNVERERCAGSTVNMRAVSFHP
jgi:hypothetical protein